MATSLLRTDKEIVALYQRHVKTVYRVCFAYMKNPADTEDAVQETFLRLIKSNPVFENQEHEKAWLIRASSNVCKNMLRPKWRKRESLQDHENLPTGGEMEIDGVFEAVAALPDRYKTVVYLYYYEGYTSAEIARALGKPQSTIRNHLSEARTILKPILGGEDVEEQPYRSVMG